MNIGNIEVYGVIYKIRNKVNNKVYIGQTTRGFNSRYQAKGEGIERVYGYHNNRRLGGESYNEHLLSSINKYGFNNFEVDKIIDVAFSETELNIKEIQYIKRFKSDDNTFGYNKTCGGNGVIVSQPMTEIMIRKMYCPVVCLDTKECFIKKKDAEDKYGIVIRTTKSKYGSKCKDGVVRKFSNLNNIIGSGKEKGVPVVCLNTLEVFMSTVEASKFYNKKRQKVTDVCRGNKNCLMIDNQKYYFCYAGDYFNSMENVTSESNINKILNNYKESLKQ